MQRGRISKQNKVPPSLKTHTVTQNPDIFFFLHPIIVYVQLLKANFLEGIIKVSSDLEGGEDAKIGGVETSQEEKQREDVRKGDTDENGGKRKRETVF